MRQKLGVLLTKNSLISELSTLKHLTSTVANIKSESNECEPDKLFKILELELRGNDKAVLSSFSKFATTAGNHLGIETKR